MQSFEGNSPQNGQPSEHRKKWRLKGREWALLLGGWQILGLTAAIVFSFSRQGFHAFTNKLILILVFTNLAALAFSLLLTLFAPLFEQWLKNRWLQVLAGGVAIVAVLLFAGRIAPRIVEMVCPMGVPHPVDKAHIAFVLANIAVIGISVLASWFIYLHARLKMDLARTIGENERLKRLEAETRFAALQSKVNPHFLFNTLNTVADMVYKQPARVEGIILNLAGVYRKVLSHPDHELTSLKDEVELVNNYLQVEKARMGDRLSYEIDVNNSLLSWQIPQMALQILVENAVLHGLSKKKEGGRIHLSAEKREGVLWLTVRDDGVGLNTQLSGNGTALNNLRERLQLLYRRGADIHLKNNANSSGGTEAILEIPRASHR